MRRLQGTLLACIALAAVAPAAAAEPVTYAGNAERTGWYPDQAGLSPGLVTGGSFGRQFSTPVEGQVYAQPLVSNGTLVVATEANRVYGLDPATGAQRWTKDLGPAFRAADVSCPDLAPTIGVTGTPVIDPATGTAYMFSKTYASGTAGAGAWYMHALDVGSGSERPGFPIRIEGSAQNNPAMRFNPTLELQRPALLLMDGVVYAAFGGHCDHTPYQGWVVGVSTTGQIKSRWVALGGADLSGAGIWQSGSGLVSDKPGEILLATGNGGSPQPAPGVSPPADLGQSVVRLHVQNDGTLSTTDFFAPYDAASLDTWDADVGSGGPVALPADPFGAPKARDLLVQTGKAGYTFLLDRHDLGGMGQGPGGGDRVAARVGPYGGVWSRPAVWPGDGGYLYMPTKSGTNNDGQLSVYRSGEDAGGNPTLSRVATSSDVFSLGSGAPVVTSDDMTSGSALVWTIWLPAPDGAGAELRAYAPLPVSGKPELLWRSPVGQATKFASPGVGQRRIYVGTRDGHVLGFGSPVHSAIEGAGLTFPATTIGESATSTATLRANEPVTVESITSGDDEFSGGSPSKPLPAQLDAGDKLELPVTFSPTRKGGIASTLEVATSMGTVSLALSGSGRAAAPELAASPPLVSFGGMRAGATAAATITLTNVGGAPLTIDSVSEPAAPFSVTSAPAQGTAIAPGDSLTLPVQFAPDRVGSFEGQVDLETSGGDEAVGLSGTAGSPPRLEIDPPAMDFGDVPVGWPVWGHFTVHNAGGSPLTIMKSKPPASGPFAAQTDLPEGAAISPGEARVISVTFSPGPGERSSATWTITGDDGSGVHEVQFAGRGRVTVQPPAPALAKSALRPLVTAAVTRFAVRPKKFSVPRGRSRRLAFAGFTLSGSTRVRLRLERASGPVRHRVLRTWELAGHAGANSIPLSGRAHGKRLRPGRYRLALTPAGGSTRSARLRIVP